MLMLANQSPDQSSSLSNWFDTWSCFFNQILQSTWKWAGTTRDFRLQKLFFAIGIFSFLCTSVLRDCGEIGSLSFFFACVLFCPFLFYLVLQFAQNPIPRAPRKKWVIKISPRSLPEHNTRRYFVAVSYLNNTFLDLCLIHFLLILINLFPVEDSIQQTSDGPGGPWAHHPLLWDPCWLFCLVEQVYITYISSVHFHQTYKGPIATSLLLVS